MILAGKMSWIKGSMVERINLFIDKGFYNVIEIKIEGIMKWIYEWLNEWI